MGPRPGIEPEFSPPYYGCRCFIQLNYNGLVKLMGFEPMAPTLKV